MSNDGLPPLREVIAKHGLNAKKSLGQNFLLDLNLTGRIARAAGPLDTCTVIEVGPGPGGLTRALLSEGARKVIAIERDERCLAALAEISDAYPGRLEVLSADAMEVDPRTLSDGPKKIVANLPYNISVKLLTSWLEDATAYESFTLMFQKEVADRLTAQPRSKDYGRLSIFAQWLCEVRPNFMVGKQAFTPPPKIDSTVVTLRPRPSPLLDVPAEALEKVTQAAFGQRRKMLRASLKGVFPNAEEVLVGLNLPPTARAEELSIEDFCHLAKALP